MPFSIPLTLDTPQCLHTHADRSSICHILIATLRTTSKSHPIFTRTVNVHIRRFSAHGLSLPLSPHTSTLSDPTTVEVQLPRTTFFTNETIPVYVTIPPPAREVVFEEHLVLRNVWAEVIRSITVLPSDATRDSEALTVLTPTTPEESSVEDGRHHCAENGPGDPHESSITRSGSACRFHSTKPIRLRLLIRNVASTDYPTPLDSDLNYNPAEDDDANCASITQATVFHSIQFRVQVRVTLLQMSTHVEKAYSIPIPITIIPSPAPLPEVDPSLDVAYRKKHDRPPAKTVRREDSDQYVDDDDSMRTGQAGPSAVIAPPPFEDAPPPFSSTLTGQISGIPSTSTSRLPTFLESEAEIIFPSDDHPIAASASVPPIALMQGPTEGEGISFGFTAAEQYDGYSYSDDPIGITQEVDPPPPIQSSLDDTDTHGISRLEIHEGECAVDSVTFENTEDGVNVSMGSITILHSEDSELPPPPPLLDDPSDPPPSIDIDFRAPLNAVGVDPNINLPSGGHGLRRMPSNALTSSDASPTTHEHQPLIQDALIEADEQPRVSTTRDTGPLAPPPYLNPVTFQNPDTHTDVDNAVGPPPYVDFVSNISS